jgi:hypothetical protein
MGVKEQPAGYMANDADLPFTIPDELRDLDESSGTEENSESL